MEEMKQLTDLTEDEILSESFDIHAIGSIDKKLTPDSEFDLSDILEGDSVNSVEEKIYNEDVKYEVDQLLNELSFREKKIMQMFFGFGEYDKLSLKEIGQEMGMSNERVRQLKIHCLAKLRGYGKIKKIKEFKEFGV